MNLLDQLRWSCNNKVPYQYTSSKVYTVYVIPAKSGSLNAIFTMKYTCMGSDVLMGVNKKEYACTNYTSIRYSIDKVPQYSGGLSVDPSVVDNVETNMNASGIIELFAA